MFHFPSEWDEGCVVAYYEWDAAKARRDYFIKFAVAWLAAIVVASVPVWIALKAGAF
jgi:hypothetical protein